MDEPCPRTDTRAHGFPVPILAFLEPMEASMEEELPPLDVYCLALLSQQVWGCNKSKQMKMFGKAGHMVHCSMTTTLTAPGMKGLSKQQSVPHMSGTCAMNGSNFQSRLPGTESSSWTTAAHTGGKDT